MIIHVKKRDNPFVQIDKRALNDERLSWKARGLLSYLLSKPSDWQVWVRDLVNRSQKDGETAVRSALKELKKWGYMQEHQSRMEDGTFGPVEYWVYEEPLGGFPQADKPQAAEPKAEKPHSENQSHTNNDSTKNEHTDNEGNKKQPIFPEKSDFASPNPPAPSPGGDGADLEQRKEQQHEQETSGDHPAGHSQRLGDLGVCDGGPVEVDRDASANISGGSINGDHRADPVTEAIIEQEQNGRTIWDDWGRTAAARAEAGNWAEPAQAGGDDAVAYAALDALYGGEPPNPDSGIYTLAMEKLGLVLAQRGVRDIAVGRKAGELMREANRKNPAFLNPALKTFESAFDVFVAEAQKQSGKASDRYARTAKLAAESQAALKERQAARDPPVEGDFAWEAAKREIALQTTKATFDVWIKDTYGLPQEDGVYTVVVPNALAKDWLDDRLKTTARRTLVGILNQQVEVHFEVRHELDIS